MIQPGIPDLGKAEIQIGTQQRLGSHTGDDDRRQYGCPEMGDMGAGQFLHGKDYSPQGSVERGRQSGSASGDQHDPLRHAWPEVRQLAVHPLEDGTRDLQGRTFPPDHPPAEQHHQAGQDLDERDPQAEQFMDEAFLRGRDLYRSHQVGNTRSTGSRGKPFHQPEGDHKGQWCQAEDPQGMLPDDLLTNVLTTVEQSFVAHRDQPRQEGGDPERDGPQGQ